MSCKIRCPCCTIWTGRNDLKYLMIPQSYVWPDATYRWHYRRVQTISGDWISESIRNTPFVNKAIIFSCKRPLTTSSAAKRNKTFMSSSMKDNFIRNMLHLTALFNIQNKPYSFVLLFVAVMYEMIDITGFKKIGWRINKIFGAMRLTWFDCKINNPK